MSAPDSDDLRRIRIFIGRFHREISGAGPLEKVTQPPKLLLRRSGPMQGSYEGVVLKKERLPSGGVILGGNRLWTLSGSQVIETFGALGSLIRTNRLRVGISQDELAERVDILDYQSVSSWELGQKCPSPRHRQTLARELGIPLEELEQACLEDFPPTRKARCTKIPEFTYTATCQHCGEEFSSVGTYRNQSQTARRRIVCDWCRKRIKQDKDNRRAKRKRDEAGAALSPRLPA